MTLVRSSQFLSLELTSMRSPPFPPLLTATSRQSSIDPEAESLLLYPGITTQMLARLKNLANFELDIHLQVKGDFPPQWCRIVPEHIRLPAGEFRQIILYFVVDEDFFESPEVLKNYSNYWRYNSLQLDYYGNLYIYTEGSHENQELLDTSNFNLFVRPLSRYLRLLPEIYQEIDFVGRFLKVPELTFDPDVEIWRNQWAYLDPLTAPKAMLPFLAYCVNWKLDPRLPLALQRLLVRYAMQIYRWRGTRRGLRLFLHLLTQLPLDEDLPEEAKHISIRENLSKKLVFGKTHLGNDSILGGGKPFYFSVHLRFDGREQIVSEEIIRSVIEQEKPAFCSYDLYIEP